MQILSPINPGLWTPALPVTDIDSQVLANVEGMRRLMQAHRGVGLAAPQCGVPFRFFIYGGCRIGGSLGILPFAVIVNPEIVWRSPVTRGAEEACLSFPGQRKFVTRPEQIKLRYLDVNPFTGAERVVENKTVSANIARLFQHEIDHLDGICVFDRPVEKKVEEGVLTES